MVATKRMIIMRGVPGSGKSHRAEELRRDALAAGLSVEVHSTDNYFVDNGVYRFDGEKLGEFHGKNQRAVAAAVRAGVDVVIVDNTNVRSHDFLSYLEVGILNDYQVVFQEPTSPWWVAARPRLGGQCEKTAAELAPVFAARNSHGVPATSIAKMLARWENPDRFCAPALELLSLNPS